MSDYFVKIFGRILDSSIWSQDDKTRILWITMLAMADENGEIQSSDPGLARRANIDLPACKTGLNVLLSPDEEDRSKVDEGRRIQQIKGGYKITNYLTYRTLARGIERKQYLTMKKREERESKRVNNGQHKSTSVNNGQHSS
jgi:hypothetical protein